MTTPPEIPNPADNQSPPKTMPVKYKFRDMKVHSTDEWMAGAKKYRKVFDRFETTYMRVEFSFFNKLFDEEEWEASIRTKSFYLNGSQKNELSNFEEKRKILKEENIVYIRHSWGKGTPGDYWYKGSYVWEAYIDDVKVGEAFFYVEDVGQKKPGENLFFDFESARLFEGDKDGASLPQKKYLSQLSQKETRYVFVEFNFRNKVNKDYYTEFIFNFCNDDGQLKGSHNYILFIPANTMGQTYTAFASWGNDVIGNWLVGSYTLQVLFLDDLIATIPFTVGEVFEEGSVQSITDQEQLAKIVAHGNTPVEDKSLDIILQESLEELNNLTGLSKIKAEVNEMVQLVKYYQETGKDVLNKFSLHSVFVGNPGTGKTTVARILSRVYKGLGILSKGHLVEVDREGLVAGYVGQTAIKTGDKVTESMGGILFIDEAYSLAQERGSPYDFGGESIQVILKRMEDNRGKFGVIVAGYIRNMQDFINSNPGLKSRFDKYFMFEDYTPDEMFIIALSMFRHEGVMPDGDAAEHLKKYFTFLYERRDEHFGNARAVRQTVSEAVKNQNLRMAAMKKEDRTTDLMATVTFSDVLEFELKDNEFDRRKLGFKMNKEQ
jgi:SpoVK/Ycf46/Vps4 family AAA+-type ATPase